MKVAFFIAFNGFRDEEYMEPKRILEKNGIDVDTVSTSKGRATGKIKITADVTTTIDEINTDGYDFIGLVGGPGALVELDNKKIYEIFSKFYASGKPVGAICISPVILAHSGLLKGRKATVWVDGVDELVKNGAFYTGNMVEVDSGIITANGPLASKEYAKAILKILKK